MLKNLEPSASTMAFPYQYKEINAGRLVNPLIQISVQAHYGWQPLWFLVDSGADTCILTTTIADQLGIGYERDRSTDVQGVGARAVSAFPGKLKLKIGEEIVEAFAYFLGLAKNFLHLGIGGRRCFLSYGIICRH